MLWQKHIYCKVSVCMYNFHSTCYCYMRCALREAHRAVDLVPNLDKMHPKYCTWEPSELEHR